MMDSSSLLYNYQDLTSHTKYNCSTLCLNKMQKTHFYNAVKRHIRKFLTLPLHLRMASSTAFNHMPYYHYLLRQSNMFCTHNPLQCFYMDISCCVQKWDFLMVNLKELYTCIMFCFKLSGKKIRNRSNAQKFLATIKLDEQKPECLFLFKYVKSLVESSKCSFPPLHRSQIQKCRESLQYHQ